MSDFTKIDIPAGMSPELWRDAVEAIERWEENLGSATDLAFELFVLFRREDDKPPARTYRPHDNGNRGMR